MNTTEAIRKLNDDFRRSFEGGKVFATRGIIDLPTEVQYKLQKAIQAFDAFTPYSDPHGEHDFGIVKLGRMEFYWKIDYYDKDCVFGSENPEEPEMTTRVLTIMLPEDY